MAKYLLIRTDGYSICTEKFNDRDSAANELAKQYANYGPPRESDNEDESYLCDTEAMLYTDCDVYVWTIIKV